MKKDAVERSCWSFPAINARTDIFLKAKPDTHDAAMIDQALKRAHAYADAGASGFFAPGLVDLRLIERLCEGASLPVNIMAFPGVPANAELASVGVARRALDLRPRASGR